MLLLVFAALTLIQFPGASFAAEIKNIKACESYYPTPLAVAVNPCRRSNKKGVDCLYHQGSRVLVEAAFKAPFASSKLEMVATAQFKGHEIHLPESGNNACLYITPGCPLKRGELYLFTYRFDIAKYYPAGVMPVRIMIRERFSNKVPACATMKIEIVEN